MSTILSTKHVILKKFTYCKIFYGMFFTNFFQGNFPYCPNVFLQTKNLNTAHTPIKIIQNLLH